METRCSTQGASNPCESWPGEKQLQRSATTRFVRNADHCRQRAKPCFFLFLAGFALFYVVVVSFSIAPGPERLSVFGFRVPVKLGYNAGSVLRPLPRHSYL